MPRVEQNTAVARESHPPKYRLTPPEDRAFHPSITSLPVPASNTNDESSVPIPEAFLESVEDPLAFLNILLSTGMELDPLTASMSLPGDETNPPDVPPGTE